MTLKASTWLALYGTFTPAMAFYAAAAAIAIPVLLHLLFRKSPQIIHWAAIRFLPVAERRHRRRIDRWLLLLLRVFALLLPLIAMLATTTWAEELWQSIYPGKQISLSSSPRTHHIIVVDGSLSMTARGEEGRTRFENAVRMAESIVRGGKPGDGYTIIFSASPSVAIVPGPATEPDKVVAELRTLKPTHGSTEMTSTLALVADAIARSPRAYPHRQISFLTDLQRSTWASVLPSPDRATPEAWQRILARSDVCVIDTARSDVENLAIVDLALADPLPMTDGPAQVTITVRNYGRTDRNQVRVELSIGRPGSGYAALTPIDIQRIDKVPAGGRAGVSFAIVGPTGFRDAGEYVLQARLTEADDLPADDVRSLAFEVREGLSAVLVEGKVETEPRRRSSWYLSEALFPKGAKKSESPARVVTLFPDELSDPAIGDLSATDCVFLCDVAAITPVLVAHLEAHLKRGGGLVIGLGPNASAQAALYNRLLYADGNGILPASIGEVISSKADEAGYRLSGLEDAFRRPPLAAFRDDNSRAALASVPFSSYVRMAAPSEDRAKRILSFVPAPGQAIPPGRKPDPALIEWQRHRGRVLVFTSAFNQDWSRWPLSPTFLPFAHEILRFAATNPNRLTLRVAETIEDYYPASAAGLSAGVVGPEGLSLALPVLSQDEAGAVRFGETSVSGLYRVGLAGNNPRAFAVNVAEGSAIGGSESDLKRVEASDFRTLGAVRVVTDPAEMNEIASRETGAILSAPQPHGPTLARYALMIALAVCLTEGLLAWYKGPRNAGKEAPRRRSRWARVGGIGATIAAVILLAIASLLIFAVIDAERTGRFLDFFPLSWRQDVETRLEIPPAAPGEGMRWRLESFTAFARSGASDKRILVMLGSILVVGTFGLYRVQRRALPSGWPLLLPTLLRSTTYLLIAAVLLPQLQLAFDREGWPEVVILIDTSASMDTVDDLKDPQVLAKAEELANRTDLSARTRLKLAQLLLAQPNVDWLSRLLAEKQVRLYVYALDSDVRSVGEYSMPADAAEGLVAIERLKAGGTASHLGDGVERILKSFRGGSLASVIVLTDGITTAGDDLPKAAREAARAGVPLYLVGLGDSHQALDLALTDLQVEDVVTRGDPIPFQARLSARGPISATPIPIVLYEKQGDKLVERTRTIATPDPTGNPVVVRLNHRPEEAGEKVFVIEAASLPGEVDLSNNRLERTVTVTEARRARVLYVEGYPRYEFRFVKALLERESEKIGGNRSVELSTLLLDASGDWKGSDKTALSGFPTRADLFSYDVVILGDFDAKQLPGGNRSLQDLADFVRIRGGGLIAIAGEHFSPSAFLDTPLADILPIVAAEQTSPKRTSEEQPLRDGYRLKLTAAGQAHPLFRFNSDEAESARIFARLQKIFWSGSGYRRKPTAEVLAVHPERRAEGGSEGENQPLVIQQFVGLGRVLFLGFDETWRWRYRADELQFDRFWNQAIRILSRSRLGRVELKLDKQTPYRRDERIVVTARFPDDAPAPKPEEIVRVLVQRAGGSVNLSAVETYSITLTKVANTRGTYQSALTRTPEGEYRFSLAEPEVTGTLPRAEARVLPPPTERDRLEMNRSDMERAAVLSGGMFYTLANADDLFTDMKAPSRIPLNQPCPPLPLWNQPEIFGLILLLLSAEWILRKRLRLL